MAMPRHEATLAMRPALALALALVAASGCLDAGDGQAPVPLGTNLAADDLTGFRVVDVADLPGGTEPGLRVAPDGTLYAIAWTRLFASHDGGATWQERQTPFRHNGDSDLAVDGAGRLHVVGMSLGKQGAPWMPHWTSDDRGATWTLASDLHPEGAIDRPWIAVAPDGRLVAAWNDFKQQRASIVASDDGGATWSRPFHVDEHWNQLLSRPVFRRAETFVPMHNAESGAAVVAHQDEPGGPWEVLPGPSVPFAAYLAPMAVDGEGILHWVAVVGQEGRQVHLWRSGNGKDWVDGRAVSGGVEAVMPWPVPLDLGVAVAFYEATPAPGDGPLPVPAPLPVPLAPANESLAWHAVVAMPVGNGWRAVRTTADPVHVGPLCSRPEGCPGGAAPFFDLFEAIALPTAEIAVAHVVHGDQRGGQHGLVVAVSS